MGSDSRIQGGFEILEGGGAGPGQGFACSTKNVGFGSFCSPGTAGKSNSHSSWTGNAAGPLGKGKSRIPSQFLSNSSSRKIAREGAGQGLALSRAGICWNFPPGLPRQVGKARIWDPARPCPLLLLFLLLLSLHGYFPSFPD